MGGHVGGQALRLPSRRRDGRGLHGSPPHPAPASYHTTMESFAEWYSYIMVSNDTCIIDSVQDVNQFGFALFYFIYIFFGILYIAVGVKIVF